MSKFFAVIKAIITRLVFAGHGIIAVWQVTIFKKNSIFWYLTSPIILLFFEGLFTLTIKENQEWKWFCPSVFLYLASVVPAIWLLELDKVDKRLKSREETFNLTSAEANLKELKNLIGVQFRLPDISLSTETWISLVEQFLMLILIIGRWMLPKGDLTRDQLSQLLLVYIGTAADIIEFFDSFKDEKVASEPVLVLLTLSIWTWSLMQFTVVLTATKSRKSRMASSGKIVKDESQKQAQKENFDLTSISIISKPNMYGERSPRPRKKEKHYKQSKRRDSSRDRHSFSESENHSEIDDFSESEFRGRKSRKIKTTRKDTGYSTGSSLASNRNRHQEQAKRHRRERSRSRNRSKNSDRSKSRDRHEDNSRDSHDSKSKSSKSKEKQKLQRSDRDTKGHRKIEEEDSEESKSHSCESVVTEASFRREKEGKDKNKRDRKREIKRSKSKKSKSTSRSFSDPSTE